MLVSALKTRACRLEISTSGPLRMEPATDARLNTLNELQIDDLAPIRADCGAAIRG
jgi:hypothetical protein